MMRAAAGYALTLATMMAFVLCLSMLTPDFPVIGDEVAQAAQSSGWRHFGMSSALPWAQFSGNFLTLAKHKHRGADGAGWARLSNKDGAQLTFIENKTGTLPENEKCPQGNKKRSDGAFCEIWESRPASAIASSRDCADGMRANIFPIFAKTYTQQHTGWSKMYLFLLAQESRQFWSEATKVNFQAVLPEEHSTEMYAFGYAASASRDLLAMFEADPNGREAVLVAKYSNAALNSSEAVELFAAVHAHQMDARSQGSNKKKSSDESSSAPAVKGPVFAAWQCFWLLHSPVGDGKGSPEMISTCGDAIVLPDLFTSGMEGYNAFLVSCNLFLLVGIVLLGVPFTIGITSQILWTRNSRSRSLHVSIGQLLFLLFWAYVDYTIIVFLGARAYPLNRNVMVLTSLLFFGLVATCFAVTLLENEQLQGTDQAVSAGTRMRTIVIIYLCIWCGGETSFLGEYATSGWVLMTAALTLWLPQALHSIFVIDGVTGLTVPLLIGGASLLFLPLAIVAESDTFMAPSFPWRILDEDKRIAYWALRCLVLLTTIFIALRMINKRHILPRWMTPWRHVYTTTVQAQLIPLQENSLCPICRNPLEEGWDDTDELWQTPCHHLFHKSCLLRWMDERMECPLCRTLLPEP